MSIKPYLNNFPFAHISFHVGSKNIHSHWEWDQFAYPKVDPTCPISKPSQSHGPVNYFLLRSHKGGSSTNFLQHQIFDVRWCPEHHYLHLEPETALNIPYQKSGYFQSVLSRKDICCWKFLCDFKLQEFWGLFGGFFSPLFNFSPVGDDGAGAGRTWKEGVVKVKHLPFSPDRQKEKIQINFSLKPKRKRVGVEFSISSQSSVRKKN